MGGEVGDAPGEKQRTESWEPALLCISLNLEFWDRRRPCKVRWGLLDRQEVVVF